MRYLYIVYSALTQDVIWTSIQCLLNVMDVGWTSKQRWVLAGLDLLTLTLFWFWDVIQIKRSTDINRLVISPHNKDLIIKWRSSKTEFSDGAIYHLYEGSIFICPFWFVVIVVSDAAFWNKTKKDFSCKFRSLNLWFHDI